MVTTGGAEGETQRKRKFVARTEGENQGGGKEGKREKGDTERENERNRMSFRGRLISLSTRLPVSLCPRFFVSLFCSTSCARKLESVTPFATRHLPPRYLHTRPFKNCESCGVDIPSITTMPIVRDIFLSGGKKFEELNRQIRESIESNDILYHVR